MQMISSIKESSKESADLKKSKSPSNIDMNRVAAIILGGGQGSRLFPLTLHDCKPAIPIAGRYKLIDIPVSNAINSGCHKIFVITQFLSASLHQHIFKTYPYNIFNSSNIELLSVEQKPNQVSWFEGTADAVRKNVEYLCRAPVDYFLILSGDQLYSMDYSEMVEVAIKTGADVVIAAQPVEQQDCHRMGILKVDKQHKITAFVEKPTTADMLKGMQMDPLLKKMLTKANKGFNYLASMGIYLFKKEALLEVLDSDPREDFGKHLLPALIENGNAAAYLFNGYWEDLGTIEAFYHANIALTTLTPPLNLYGEEKPIFSSHNNLPGAKILNANIHNCLICGGSVIEAQEMSHCVVGPRTIIQAGCVVKDSYLIGNDSYESHYIPKHLPRRPMIGANTVLTKCIVDKNVTIGKNVRLVNENNLSHYDGENIYIRDGIIVVPREASIPDGFVL